MSQVETQELPEQGEVLLGTVTQIASHGVYVTLEEYGGLRGYLPRQEVSTGWVRHVERFVKMNQKIVLKTIRVNRARREVDLSLRQVTQEERRNKVIEAKQVEKARVLIDEVSRRLNLPKGEIEKISDRLVDEFGSLYSVFEDAVKKGTKFLEKLQLQPELVAVLEEVAKEKIVIPQVMVRGIMELKSDAPDGVESIRNALREAETVKSGGSKVNVTYLGAPRYYVTVKANDYKTAEKALEAAVEKAQEVIEKKRGEFSFKRP